MAELLNRVHNDIVFDQVLQRVQALPQMDPTLAFQNALPGFLNEIVEMEGPWPGRDTKRWAIAGAGEIGKAIGPDQRARIGGVSEKHIVALRGFEVAGVTQKIGHQDGLYGGTSLEQKERKALMPLRSFNERASKSMFDVVTAGDFSGSIAEDFRWFAQSQDGETVQADIHTDTADSVPDVYANSTQTFLWPLRTGGLTGTGHDHVIDTGAVWALAGAATARDLVMEHPGAARVRAYVSSTVAALVRAQAKTEYGAIVERVDIVKSGAFREGGFGSANSMGIVMDGVEYVHAPDIPADKAIYVAANQKPFHMHIGNTGVDGSPIGRGSWTEIGDQERLGKYFGFRDVLSLGMKNPVGAVYAAHDV
jgi:hypothetical protein